MATQQLTSEKYLADSLNIEKAMQRKVSNQRSADALVQFAMASCLIVLVVFWEAWLPTFSGQIYQLAKPIIGFARGY